MTSYIILENKLTPPDRIAEMALDDPELLRQLLEGIGPSSQKSARRENCSQAIMHMAEVWPEMLLPHWKLFMELFKSNNGSSKYVAAYVIASLSKADQTGLTGNSIDEFMSVLDDDSVMVASHVALNSGKIALAKPELREKIIEKLLKIDDTHHDEAHKALVTAYVLNALEMVYEVSSQKNQIHTFVEKQTSSSSPKTQKQAKALLKKWGSS